MIKKENHIGQIILSENYLTEIVRHTVTGCFGVADVCSTGVFQSAVMTLISGKVRKKNKGVIIHTYNDGSLKVDLHIKVTYGTNITAAVDSIVNKVRFTLEETAGVTVGQVRVCVDDIKA